VSFFRRIGGSDEGADPVGGLGGPEEIRRVARTSTLAVGTLACPTCDAPVSPGHARLGPASPLACPFCGHAARVRDFLTLGAPTRAAHVVIKVVSPAEIRISRRRDDDDR
jgi:hypothetical protein